MRDAPNRRNPEEGQTAALDPIALTLAIWLGVVVTITALGRLAQDAETQAALAGQRNAPSLTQAVTVPFASQGG